MEFLLFNFLFLAVTASNHDWGKDTEKECTRYRIWAKAVFEGNFPAKVVLGVPANVEMSDKVAIMNVRKGCREMCGGKCTYRGKDLFNAELCEEFEGFGGPTVPDKIVKPPKPHHDDGMPAVDYEPEYIDWDPFWWMEAEKERMDYEKEKHIAEYGSSATFETEGSWWFHSEGSYEYYDWQYYGFSSSYDWDKYMYSFDKMEEMMTSFEDTWESYDWADFYAQPVWSSFDYDKIYVPPSAKWEDSWMEYEKFDWEKEDWNITYWEMDKYEYEKIAYGRTMNSPMMRMVGHTLPPALKRYLSNYACGIDIGGEDVTPECKKAKDDFAAADGTLEEMTLQGACLEHCGEACGFLVNSVSFLLMSLCYFLFNEMH